MTQRERGIRCLEFKPADRLCLDGAFRPEVWKMLECHFGTENHTKIRKELGIGFLIQVTEGPDPKWLEHSKETEHGRAIIHSDGSLETEWGVRKVWDDTGTYERYVYHPLSESENFKTYRFPSLDASGIWDGFKQRVEQLKKTELVAAPIPTFYRWGWELRGMENFMCDIAMVSKELIKLLDMLEEYHIELARRYGQMGVDVLQLWGDLAMQTTTLMAPDMWRKHFKPRMATVIETAKNNGIQYIYLHSDGNNMPIVEDFIEIGINILDPVQPECMDPVKVREMYPNLVIHGTISGQKTLPFGSIEDVRKEVMDRIERCGFNNGLVIAPMDVQFDVPLQNLLCIYETVKEVGESFYRRR